MDYPPINEVKLMPKYVVYEVWTTARVITARDIHHAYLIAEPKVPKDSTVNLCNWHIVPVTKEK